jgi:hypothetical protein
MLFSGYPFQFSEVYSIIYLIGARAKYPLSCEFIPIQFKVKLKKLVFKVTTHNKIIFVNSKLSIKYQSIDSIFKMTFYQNLNFFYAKEF